ncbi:hypothetical protein [Cohnella boryungensis]|uniref:SMI1/KNR4 family protein n=1 Tax=Cohnella boryungensis TaxID=768479 RepID=A0ABV8SBR1_9BACL
MNEPPEGRDSSPSASLPLSFRHMGFATQEELTRRIEAVKVLSQSDQEMYRIVKDRDTGDHFLHFAVYHLNVAGGGAEEEYHHLLPLEHDDVIALALGASLYEYPSDWKRTYLRNGPSGGFVWYDPSGTTEEERSRETEAFIRSQLLAFRKRGALDAENVRRLLDRIDRHLDGEGPEGSD